MRTLSYGQSFWIAVSAALLVASALIGSSTGGRSFDDLTGFFVAFGGGCGAAITAAAWTRPDESDTRLSALFLLTALAAGVLAGPVGLLVASLGS